MTLPSIVGSLSARSVLLGSVMDFKVPPFFCIPVCIQFIFYECPLTASDATLYQSTQNPPRLAFVFECLALISFSMAVDIQGGLSLRIFRAQEGQ